MSKISLFIVDHDLQALDALASAARQAPDLTIVGKATSGQAVLDRVAQMRPDVAVVSLDLPGTDVLKLIRELVHTQKVCVLATSAAASREKLEQAWEAGAREHLSQPFLPREFAETIHGLVSPDQQVPAGDAPRAAAAVEPPRTPIPLPPKEGKIVTVFGTKGGVGKTTIAVNLAAALSEAAPKRVVLVDLDLEFGNAAAMLGAKPLASIIDLWGVRNDLSQETAERILLNATSNGLRLLAAPPTPDLAAELEAQLRPGQENELSALLKALTKWYEWVVVDTASSFREVNLSALDVSDEICLVTAPDIPTLQNTGKCLDILLDQLEFDRAKVRLVLNHADAAVGLSESDVAGSLGVPVSHRIPRDTTTAGYAANSGHPFIIRRPTTAIAKAVGAVAGALQQPAVAASEAPQQKRSLFGRAAQRRKGA